MLRILMYTQSGRATLGKHIKSLLKGCRENLFFRKVFLTGAGVTGYESE